MTEHALPIKEAGRWPVGLEQSNPMGEVGGEKLGYVGFSEQWKGL